MKIIDNIDELRQNLKNLDGDVGFVPTMGALHKGHISLIEKSKSENKFTIVSVFVNPTQFLEGEDFDKYPKNESSDARICEICGADILFLPKADEIYSNTEPLITAPKELASILEGATRPGHFDGVLRVINKFINIIKPKRIYFGKKDSQQLAIVNNMIKSFFMDVEIVPCETVREADGLAFSSRNAYLSEEDKINALKISRALLKASNLVKKGELSSKNIILEMKTVLEPLKVDYVAIVNKDFKEISQVEIKNTIILVAAYVGKTRLIDNIWI